MHHTDKGESSMKKQVEVEIIVTGGTFEKTYNQHTGELDFEPMQSFQDCATIGILAQARADKSVAVCDTSEGFIDSLDMDDHYRMNIAYIMGVEDYVPGRQFVIVHGTDTMAQSAEFFAEKFRGMNIVIVLTGAMQPHTLGDSDAGFNLGYAIACAQMQAPGVYIAMNGQCFDAGHVEKDRENLVFVPKD